MEIKGIIFICMFFCGAIGIMTANNEETFWISYALFSIGGYLFCQYHDEKKNGYRIKI